jgi:hypothetical protein
MTSPACLPALLLAASFAVIAAPRLGLGAGPWSTTAKTRALRMATAVLIGSFAVGLALSLVGVKGGAVDRSPAIQIGILASMAVAAFLIWRSRGSGVELR